MITGAAACPCPPLLARELTGQEDVLPELRAACAQAIAWLLSTGPDLLVVAGPDERTAPWPADGRLDLAAYAPALAGPGPGFAGPGWSGSGLAGAGRPAVPLSLGLGARLLDEAGYAGPRALHAVGVDEPPAACLSLGASIAALAPRVALLAMGDGTARRAETAPGYLDERAAPFDAVVERAFRDGDLAALAGLDPVLAAGLLAAGRPAWQVLAGALAAGPPALDGPGPASLGGTAGGRPVTRVLYADAPLGVAYLVATLEPGGAGR
jgi:hypothetical protein